MQIRSGGWLGAAWCDLRCSQCSSWSNQIPENKQKKWRAECRNTFIRKSVRLCRPNTCAKYETIASDSLRTIEFAFSSSTEKNSLRFKRTSRWTVGWEEMRGSWSRCRREIMSTGIGGGGTTTNWKCFCNDWTMQLTTWIIPATMRFSAPSHRHSPT